jgi:hypothetical protein
VSHDDDDVFYLKSVVPVDASLLSNGLSAELSDDGVGDRSR